MEESARTHDLGHTRVDTDRARRTGDPEVVYGAGVFAARVARNASPR